MTNRPPGLGRWLLWLLLALAAALTALVIATGVLQLLNAPTNA